MSGIVAPLSKKAAFLLRQAGGKQGPSLRLRKFLFYFLLDCMGYTSALLRRFPLRPASRRHGKRTPRRCAVAQLEPSLNAFRYAKRCGCVVFFLLEKRTPQSALFWVQFSVGLKAAGKGKFGERKRAGLSGHFGAPRRPPVRPVPRYDGFVPC